MINTIRDIRHQRQDAGLGDDFLYTSNMFSHWMLGESRHGFPHAAHFSAISQGWFSNWNPRSVMPGFPTTTDNLCRKITLSGPSIVLVPKNSALFECMSSKPPINYSINGIFFDYDGPVAVMCRDISHSILLYIYISEAVFSTPIFDRGGRPRPFSPPHGMRECRPSRSTAAVMHRPDRGAFPLVARAGTGPAGHHRR